jgi:2-polyprenyl-6-hydroxyphenyl methylase/3-demethylubiquinone-9 3-methyltransferase
MIQTEDVPDIKMADTDLANHFAFGENWESYSKLIDSQKIDGATSDLLALVGQLTEKSFLDIGCGSGLHAVAALRLGADSVMAVDIDPKSVETARATLSRFAPTANWRAEAVSVLSPKFDQIGQFDTVYSWGVLHHTGNMQDAIRRAAARVKPDGLFAIAIYSKTPFCSLWRIEKRLYTNSPKLIQSAIFSVYKLMMNSLIKIKSVLTGTRKTMKRGMDIDHDYRDWLGGYPYESATPGEIDNLVIPLGFEKIKQQVPKRNFVGLFGTGCAEYLYKRHR